MYGLYIAVASFFSILVLISVIRSVREMTPPRLAPSDSPAAFASCILQAEKLWLQLEQERVEITSHHEAKQADHLWVRFRKEWLVRFRQVEADCAVDREDRGSLRPAFRRLETVLDLYTTHAVQYSGEIGPAVDALRAELEKQKALPNAQER
jgi:hypothetical protein